MSAERIRRMFYFKVMGDVQIYKEILYIFDYDVNQADAFMLSDDGGYTQGQLNEIKYKIENEKQRYARQQLV
jgi:hypothetical protein